MEEQTKSRSETMLSYLSEKMTADVQDFISGAGTKSGYVNLDAVTSLYPGLYVLGAISSLGKTTFVHQMADQMAKAGHPVLFFSLEQNLLELASKSLSRIMAEDNAATAMTSLQIRKKNPDEQIEKAIREYSQYAGNLTVVQCSFRITMDDIEDYVRGFIREKGVKPCVIVDYLQVIQATEGCHMSTKDLVDQHVRRLKILQADHKLVMIVISSLNRQNYLTQIDCESFKESGGIEYTADVIWGLQLQILHDPIFDKQNALNEKRLKVREAKRANPRKIELVCLKNRFGVSSYTCNFDYYPQFDLFKPDMSGISLDDMETDPDGFIKVPKGYGDIPFDRKVG